MVTDDDIRRLIREKKAVRLRNTSNGHNEKVLRWVLPAFFKSPNRILNLEDIEIAIEKQGGNYSSAGPATTFGVREGYLERLGRGKYRATGKPLAQRKTV